ncbi:MAG TPA: erythromycin esterase family protein [Cryomorphaceae bacterium]|nr:erythromycin esterase family protein [Cryomorphaceae bacterium]
MNKKSIADHLKAQKKDFSTVEDLDSLLHSIKDKKVVMMGEASHGTHEYYNWRARISRKLIEEYDFDFVAVEGDWPPCYKLNRYVKNYEDAGKNTQSVLQNFERWPAWMWANWEVHEWAEWLKNHNKGRSADERAGFYGLDVYSLWESMDAIMAYLKKEDPSALAKAQEAMRCFEPFRKGDEQKYALSTRLVPEGCSKEVSAMLTEIRNKAAIYNSDKEHVFSTEQNAEVAKNAEEYYRVMVQGGASTWNLRDRHMMDTLNRLMSFHGKDAKGIVWAHNTHIGDASYTDMKDDGLFNIGQLAREEYGKDNTFLMGFGSRSGSLLAGSSWGANMQKMELPEARENSWEDCCHEVGKQFYVRSEDISSNPYLQNSIPHRAVGVVYNPAVERYGNYVPTIIPKRYDAFLFFDQSEALNAMDIDETESKVPETYPFGL